MARYHLPAFPNGWFQVAFSDEAAPGGVRSREALLCDGDGPIAQYRRSARQFYSGLEEPAGAGRKEA